MSKYNIFKKSIESLQSVSNLCEEYYLCPICLRGFDEKALEENILTFEHVPQKTIGGKKLILTCKKCNSEAGYKFEADLQKREKVQSAIHAMAGIENFEGRIKLDFGGVVTNSKAQIENGNIRFEINDDINNPLNLNKQIDYVREHASGFTLDFEMIDQFSKHKVKVAYLKSAYLAAFVTLGYSYILRKELDIIRKQICNPVEYVVPQIFLQGKGQATKRIIFNVSEPINSIVVYIDRKIILLPPVENTGNPYDNIVDFVKNIDKDSELTGINLGWPSSLEFQYDKYLNTKIERDRKEYQ